ncbi:transmembrane amino acid transporter protein-domain-containing protein [Entophlyctis helioformis]|nr:transmembrane amino acid transporter protein-domain-containing protein [Entophlyctis helioformis]
MSRADYKAISAQADAVEPTASLQQQQHATASGSGSATPVESTEASSLIEVAGSKEVVVHASGASNNEALYHIVCVIAGTGILQIPYALRLSGWIGLPVLLFAAIVNDYTGKLLVRCLYHHGQRINGGYPDIGRIAFGSVGEGIVQVFYNTILVGCTCLYLILAGMNLETLVGVLDQKAWILVCSAVILVPFILMRTLKEVAIISFFGAFASIVVVIIVVALGIIEFPEYNGRVEHTMFDFAKFPYALGTFSFSYGGNYVYAEVERTMANPQAFPLVLSRAMSIITVMYMLTGAVAYGTYGDLTLSPILSNLPQGWVTTFSIIVITAHVLLACPLLVTTFSAGPERALGLDEPEDTPRQKLGRALLRTLIMVFIAVVSITVPFFSDLMTFLGAVANTMLIFVFPVVFYYKIFGVAGRGVAELAFAGLIIAVGIMGGCIGGYESLVALYNDFVNSRA